MATIGAAARRLGKVWQLKSFLSSVKHPPCVPCLTHQWGGGDRDGHERERNMFGLQISQNIGCEPCQGVRKKERTLPPELLMMMMMIPPRPPLQIGVNIFLHLLYEYMDFDKWQTLFQNKQPLILIWWQKKSLSLNERLNYHLSFLRQAPVLVTYATLPPPKQLKHPCVPRFPVVMREVETYACVLCLCVKVVRHLLWSDEGTLVGKYHSANWQVSSIKALWF